MYNHVKGFFLYSEVMILWCELAINSQGFLKKLRKEGKIYLGSRWQKRYCVVRNHVLYYFREKKAKEQAGQILLPGYKAQVANKKGREFFLTHSQSEIRTYQVRA